MNRERLPTTTTWFILLCAVRKSFDGNDRQNNEFLRDDSTSYRSLWRSCTLFAAFSSTRIWIFSPNIVRRLKKLRIDGPYFLLLIAFLILSAQLHDVGRNLKIKANVVDNFRDRI